MITPKAELRPGTLEEIKDYLKRTGYRLINSGKPDAQGRLKYEYGQTGNFIMLYEMRYSMYSFGVLVRCLAKIEKRKAIVIHREIIGL